MMIESIRKKFPALGPGPFPAKNLPSLVTVFPIRFLLLQAFWLENHPVSDSEIISGWVLGINWYTHMLIWNIIAIAVIAWQIVALHTKNYPTFGEFLRLSKRYWLMRWFLILFWIWTGWHLFVRATY